MSAQRIRATLHHGMLLEVKEYDAPAITESVVLEALEGCAYGYNGRADLPAIVTEIKRSGSSGWGWVHLERIDGAS